MEKKNEVIEVSDSPSQILQIAIEQKAGIEVLERLMLLKERHEQNEARKAYHVAMTEFKANAPSLKKDKKAKFDTKQGDKVGYAYASLFGVVKAIGLELSKHGLSATWSTKQNGAIIVTCRITHVRGYSEEVTLSAQADTSGCKNSIQAIGSTVAYLQRYTILAATGLAAADMDDDGQKATELIDDKQKSTLVDMMAAKNVKITLFCSKFEIKELSDLPKAKYQQAIVALEAKKVAK